MSCLKSLRHSFYCLRILFFEILRFLNYHSQIEDKTLNYSSNVRVNQTHAIDALHEFGSFSSREYPPSLYVTSVEIVAIGIENFENIFEIVDMFHFLFFPDANVKRFTHVCHVFLHIVHRFFALFIFHFDRVNFRLKIFFLCKLSFQI